MNLWDHSFGTIRHLANGPDALDRLRKSLLFLLAVIGSGTVLFSVGAAGLRLSRNHPPDSRRELVSPDGRYRIVITEEIVGFPGSSCVKQVYVLGVRDTFDRNDEDDMVFAGACDGVSDIRWNGARIEGTVIAGAAVAGVRSLILKRYGANGKVQLSWAGR